MHVQILGRIEFQDDCLATEGVDFFFQLLKDILCFSSDLVGFRRPKRHLIYIRPRRRPRAEFALNSEYLCSSWAKESPLKYFLPEWRDVT